MTVPLLVLSSCFESEAETQQQTTAPTQTETTSALSLTGLYCLKTEGTTAALVAIDRAQENRLQFSMSVWNSAGQDCGIVNGSAESTGNGQFLYSSAEEDCSIEFDTQDGVRIAQKGSCRSMCGSAAQIGNIHFAESTKIRTDVSDVEIEMIYEAPVPLCPQ